MDAPFNPHEISHGSPDMLFEFIREALIGVVAHAEAGIGYCDFRAASLLALSLRNTAACLDTALSSGGDLADYAERSRRREKEDAR